MTERNENLLDRIVDEIRNEPDTLDPAIETAALARAWERIESEEPAASAAPRVLGCEEIQALLPAHRAGELKRERELLIEDHLRSCVPCRRALRELEAGPTPVPEAAPHTTGGWSWRLAAAAVVLLGLALVPFLVLRGGAGDGAEISLAEGSLFALEGDEARRIEPGQTVDPGAELRTPRGEGAVIVLGDGTRVEMRERTRLAVRDGRGGTTLDLAGGNLIVEAAKQKEGRHLYVQTDDCLVSVVGTVFTVNDGTKGSRVSVLEGEVHVDQAGRAEVLRAGDQVTTNERVAKVRLDEEIAWSADRERHLALLRGIAALDRELAALPRPQARYGSALLESMPADTVIYAAFPNLTDTWQQGLARLTERVASEPALSQWIQDGELDRVRTILEEVLDLGDFLGEEIVVAGWQDAVSEVVGPVLVADALAPEALVAALEQEIAVADPSVAIHLVENPYDPALADADGLLVYVSDRHLVAAPNAQALSGAAAALAGAAPTFHGSDLYARIADRYRDGVESLVAIDLGRLLAANVDVEEQARLERLGVFDTEHLILEQWSEGESTRRQAVVSFRDARHGLASWLAAPAPMGSLSFVSPDATSAFAVVFRRPEELFAEVLAALTDEERAEAEQKLTEMEAETGWNLQEDVFQPLGGELAFAIDGPLAPTPAWKLVVEVYDPNRLQAGLERMVTDLSGRLAAEADGTIELAAGDDGLWHLTRVKADGRTTQAVYGYFDGYLVAAPSAALVDRARRYRESEVNLLTSPRLLDLLPADAQTNFSALWFYDLSAVTEPLGGLVAGLGDSVEMDDATRDALEQFTENVGPSLAWAYGEPDQIVVGSNSPRSPLAWLGWLAAQGAS